MLKRPASKVIPVYFFEQENNQWRKKPATPETPEQLKQRLAGMLHYYAKYYRLVNNTTTYFIPKRVILPIKYYQHGVGLESFDVKSRFATECFYDSTQAKAAHRYLGRAMQHISYPSGENFVDEYARCMDLMADKVKKL